MFSNLKGSVDLILRNFSWYMSYREKKILKEIREWEAYQEANPHLFAV